MESKAPLRSEGGSKGLRESGVSRDRVGGRTPGRESDSQIPKRCAFRWSPSFHSVLPVPRASWPQLSNQRHRRFEERGRVSWGGKRGGASPGSAASRQLCAPPPTPQTLGGASNRPAPHRPALPASGPSAPGLRPGTVKSFLKKPILTFQF